MKRLPDFLIAGVMKGGTTALYEALCEHPQIWARPQKEIHYFSLYYERGPDWYTQFFQDCPPGQLTGEASPSYFDGSPYYPVLERLQNDVPNLPCIVILRDPIQRAISHFHHAKRYETGLDPALDEHDFFAPERILAVTQGDSECIPPHLRSVLNNSLYRAKLERWLQHMPNTLVLTQAQLQDPKQSIGLSQKLCAHLGLRTVLLPLTQPSSMVGHYAPPPASGAWLEALQAFYRDEYHWLEEQGFQLQTPQEENFDNRQFWNLRYQNPELSWLGSGPGSRGMAAKYKAKIINELLTTTGARSILDAGCGDGCWLADLPAHIRYHGLDIADAVIERLQAQHPQHQFTQIDLTQAAWPEHDGLVVCLDVLIHQTALQSLHAMLDRLLSSQAQHLLVSYFSAEANPTFSPGFGDQNDPSETEFQQARAHKPAAPPAETSFFGLLPKLIAQRPQGALWNVEEIGRYRFQTIYHLHRRPMTTNSSVRGPIDQPEI